MDIDITDAYGYKEDYSYLNEVIKETLTTEKVENAIFSITFVDTKTIQELNRMYRHVDAVTDVISFAFEDALDLNPKDTSFRSLGEIYICIPKMQEQAKNYGHSEKRELAFLTVHGLLHLLGYDHMNKEEETVMFNKQELILNATNITR